MIITEENLNTLEYLSFLCEYLKTLNNVKVKMFIYTYLYISICIYNINAIKLNEYI